MFNAAWWNNMSDELKGFTIVLVAGLLLIGMFVLSNLVFNIIAVKNGLHQQESTKTGYGYIWVKQ